MVSRVSFVLLALLPAARALSTAPNAAAAGTARVIADVETHLAETGGVSQKGVYAKQYDAGIQLDQAAFESPLFWAELDTCLPKKWRADPALKRFKGFCENLRTKEPGVDVFLENGQQLLAQYQYPGLEGPRAAYPAEHYPELAELQARPSVVVELKLGTVRRFLFFVFFPAGRFANSKSKSNSSADALIEIVRGCVLTRVCVYVCV